MGSVETMLLIVQDKTIPFLNFYKSIFPEKNNIDVNFTPKDDNLYRIDRLNLRCPFTNVLTLSGMIMKSITTLLLKITAAMVTIPLITTVAMAQMAEVPQANAQGDFMTAKVQGNRGLYNNEKWLVVDPESLNCRNTPNGTVKVKLEPGAIITAIFSNNGKGDAITLKNGQPWLKVENIHPAGTRFNSGICYVRANLKYIAPINQDYLDFQNRNN